jgi:hypothetical protein
MYMYIYTYSHAAADGGDIHTPRKHPGGKGGINGIVPTNPKGNIGGNMGGTFPIPLTNSDRTTMSQINARKRLQMNSIKMKENPRRVYDYSKGSNGEDEVKN